MIYLKKTKGIKTMGKVIALVNQKGGVGKTTTTFNLGHILANKGKKVLLIDFDPQSSLTICFGEPVPSTTIYELLLVAINDEADFPKKQDYIMRSGNLDCIAAKEELAAIEMNLINVMSRETMLKKLVETLTDDYDYILIDCCPSLGMLTINALVAADSVIIPSTPEFLSAKGLEALIRNILKVRKALNPSIEIAGILLTMYNERTNLSGEIDEMIQDAYGKHIKIFKSRIPHSVKVGEASMQNQSVTTYKSKNPAAEAYDRFSEEVLNLWN